MPERTYRVTFKDGTVEVVKAHDEQQARMRARGKRPLGRRSDPVSHATIQHPLHEREIVEQRIRETPGFKSSRK